MRSNGGLAARIGYTAQPEEQRAEGFGVLRVVANLSWIIGPSIGGFFANRSYFALFVTDAVISSVVAVLFYLLITETKPEASAEVQAESMLQTFKGYFIVLGGRVHSGS